MITCFLQGGLGNQLFQIFTTLVYGFKQNRKVVFTYSSILTSGMDRPTYWENFLISLQMFTNLNPNFNLTNDDILNFPCYFENGYPWQPFPTIGVDENIQLRGYFQTAKYFDDYRSTIFKMIRLTQQKNTIMDNYKEYFSGEKHTISMHFRLGDYKSKQQYHPIIGFEYYQNAIKHILSMRTKEYYRILYFCEAEDNDIIYGHIQNLQNMYSNIEFIKVDDKIEDWKQMLIMSCCSDNIIPNSTFSWWGAYFNENTDKIVCYPCLWFGPYIVEDLRDMFPDEWYKITL